MRSADGRAAARSFASRDSSFLLLALGLIAVVALISWLVSEDLAIVFGVLGVLGVICAVFQFGDARNTIRSIKKVGQDLSTSTERLEDQLSTRRIGVFPDFMPKIVELLRSATESVVIFVDFPAYGEFSKPEAFKEYAEVIEDKSSLIQLLCLDDDARCELTRDQVGSDPQDDRKGSNDDRIREYLDFRGLSYELEPLDRDAFVQLLAAGDTNTLEGEFGAAERWVTTVAMPLYFWIVDDEDAVFALAQLEPDALEVGFRTSDADMIGALKGIFERYKGMDQTRKFTGDPATAAPGPPDR